MDLENFIYGCFKTISPTRTLSKNWHIKIISQYLESIQQHKRLIINIPPRCMKSTCVSIAWPAWMLGKDPSLNIIVASYSKDLSTKHSLDTRYIIQSDWYKNIFPNTILSKEENTKHKFKTVQRGFRLATSIGATLTGEGGDILIADDPITPMEANSVRYRKRIIDWFEQVFASRLNSLKTGIIVIVMHRLHEEDLISYLIAKKHSRWTQLSLQMVTESAQNIYCGDKLLYCIKKNEILDKNRYNEDDIETIKQDVGSYVFAAQYQQSPLPISGNIIKKEHFRRYKTLQIKDHEISQSWDTASGINEKNDYSVCITYTLTNNYIYIIDVLRRRLDYPSLKNTLIKLAKDYEPYEILIEKKSSGTQLLQDLSKQTFLPLVTITPKKSKFDRLNIVLPLIEEGKIVLPYYASWLADFENELISFPHSKHDDQVDSLTQLLIRIKNRKHEEMRLRIL